MSLTHFLSFQKDYQKYGLFLPRCSSVMVDDFLFVHWFQIGPSKILITLFFCFLSLSVLFNPKEKSRIAEIYIFYLIFNFIFNCSLFPGNTGPSLVLVSAAVVCLLGLLMPTEGDQTPTRIPQYLHLNANIKIVLAYVLGKVQVGLFAWISSWSNENNCW